MEMLKNKSRLSLSVLLITMTLGSNTARPQTASAAVATSFSGLVYNRTTQTYNSVLTITNKGPALTAPLGIFISTNNSSVTVSGANDQGEIFDSQLPGNSLASGGTAQVTVAFVNPTKTSFVPTARVIAGGQMLLQVLQSLVGTGALPKLDTSSSLTGPDANQNGIRDDIDTLIAALPDTAVQRAALSQEARNLQNSLTIDTSSPTTLLSLATSIDRGVDCVYQRYPAAMANDRLKWIQMITVNTMIRSQAYNAFNLSMNGSVIHSHTGVACDG